MSIPLDRLYNFLDSISNHNLLIYVWQPHGSKKLRDIVPLRPLYSTWKENMVSPTLLFHDQEPLDYDFSDWVVQKEFLEAVQYEDDFLLSATPLMQEFYKKFNLKSVLEFTFYDLTLLVHSEKNSSQVLKFEQNNFVPVYYWSHALIARDWFRFAEHDPLLKISGTNQKTFLVYNRAWTGSREYRLKFVEQLLDYNLYHDCITSFSPMDQEIHYTQHQFKNSAFSLNRKDLEKILPKNPHLSSDSADYNNIDYQNSMIEIVLETLFDDSRHHLTEKSLRPIACKKPFILVGPAGSLQYLKNYGFKTFEGYIDETYDTIDDPILRMSLIISEMQRISQMSPEQKHQLINNLSSIVEHNQQWFFSTKFQDLLINEFLQNLNIGIFKVKQGPIGKLREQLTIIAKNHYPELFQKYRGITEEETTWMDAWIATNSTV